MLTVREIQLHDIELITQYWLGLDDASLMAMGAEPGKMPTREHWHKMLTTQLELPYPEKQAYGIVWVLSGQAVGHCNVNKIKFGEEAYMHLHLWQPDQRQKGIGTDFVKLSLPYFFENLQLQRVLSEPYALNPAPNKALEKAGFQFVRSMVTTPGWLNFEQEVHLWEMGRDRFLREAT